MVNKITEVGEVPTSGIKPGELTEEGEFVENRVEGKMVRVGGGENSVKADSGNVSGDEVILVCVFDVVVSFGEKAFESGKLSEGVRGYATRRPKHLEVGNKAGVVEGGDREFEGAVRRGDREEFETKGDVGVEFFPTEGGVTGDEGGGGHEGEVGFSEVRVNAIKAGGAGRNGGVIGMKEVGVGVLFDIRKVKLIE